jgi:hypothetical protein
VSLWNQTAEQEDALSTRALVPTLVIAVAVAVPAADAHTLSKAAAKREAAKVGVSLARDVGGAPVYDCRRRSAHAFVCRISVVGLEGDVCVTAVRVSYRNRRDRRLSRRVVRPLECQPPELPGIL